MFVVRYFSRATLPAGKAAILAARFN